MEFVFTNQFMHSHFRTLRIILHEKNFEEKLRLAAFQFGPSGAIFFDFGGYFELNPCYWCMESCLSCLKIKTHLKSARNELKNGLKMVDFGPMNSEPQEGEEEQRSSAFFVWPSLFCENCSFGPPLLCNLRFWSPIFVIFAFWSLFALKKKCRNWARPFWTFGLGPW